MKILISHDVDHLYSSDHLHDGILVKFAVRSTMELVLGRIGAREVKKRIKASTGGKWNNIDEIMEHDERKGIPSVFFFGTANGLGLSYSLDVAAPWIKRVESRGFETGVHGIAFDDRKAIGAERERFKSVTGRSDFGIRMHYLRSTEKTSEMLAAAGYSFDATPYESGNPWVTGGMPVFPLHVMDGRFLQQGRYGVQAPDRKGVLEMTKQAVLREAMRGTKFFSLLFHDRYYSEEFDAWKWWYEEMTDYFLSEGHTFVSYEDARRQVLAECL